MTHNKVLLLTIFLFDGTEFISLFQNKFVGDANLSLCMLPKASLILADCAEPHVEINCDCCHCCNDNDEICGFHSSPLEILHIFLEAYLTDCCGESTCMFDCSK